MFYSDMKRQIRLMTLFAILLLFSAMGFPQVTHAKAAKQDTVVTLTMKNFKFVPNDIQIPAGEKVRLKFQNKGTVVHAFMAGNGLTQNLKGFKHGMFSGVTVTKKVNGKTSTKTYNNKSLMLGVKPGHSATLTFTMPESKSGSYHFGCFKTAGTGGTKHYTLGMKGMITVSQAADIS